MAQFISGQVEQSQVEKIKGFFKNISSKRTLSLLGILFIVLALPVTIYFSMQQQTYQQRAAPVQNELSTLNFELDDYPMTPIAAEDIIKAKNYLNHYEHLNLKPIIRKIPSEGIQPEGKTTFSITPILFIASDKKNNFKYKDGITTTFNRLKIWYNKTLTDTTGHAFNIKPLEIYKAPQPLDYYKCPNHISPCDTYDSLWGNMQNALYDKGYPLWSMGQTYVVFVVGGGGFAGGGCVAQDGYSCGINSPYPGPAGYAGLAIVGDWALDTISGIRNDDCIATLGTACSKNAQRGAVGHETGHTFGLAHANQIFGSIMWDWWDFPNVSLIEDPLHGNDEKGLLRSSPFFHKTPPLAPTIPPMPTSTITPTPDPLHNQILWQTPQVSLQADNFNITIKGKTYFAKTKDFFIHSSPGLTSQTLEAVWHENGVKVELNFFFTYAPGENWNVSQIRVVTYKGTGGYALGYPGFTGTSLGTSYAIPLLDIHSINDETSTIHFENLQLQPFLDIPTPTPTMTLTPTIDPNLTLTPAPTQNKISWHVYNAELDADNFYLVLHGKKYLANPNTVNVSSEKQSDYIKFEIRWHENDTDILMRIWLTKIYNSSQWNTSWETYENGEEKTYWDETITADIGKPFTADSLVLTDYYKTGEIHFENLKLQSFF